MTAEQRQRRARFRGEKTFTWTVQVEGERYMILTKPAPFQPRGSLRYTIWDKQEGVRGATNVIGNGWDFQTKGPYIGARALHVSLLTGATEISHHNRVSASNEDVEIRGDNQ